VGDAEARRMQRRRGVRGRLDVLRILLLYCEPFCTFDLSAHFLERDHAEMFRTLLAEDGMGRGPTPLEAEVEMKGRMEHLPVQMTCEVRQVEQMPFWTEREEARARKKARKERLREQSKQNGKKTQEKVAAARKPAQKKRGGSTATTATTAAASTDSFGDSEQDDLSSMGDRSMGSADGAEDEHWTKESSSSPCCHLCSSDFVSDELPIACASCQIQTHVLCLADKFLEDCRAPPSVLVPIDGLCPSCGSHMIWDAIMDERRQVQAETNGYFGGELLSTRKGYDSYESDDNGIICLSDDEDEDEDEDEKGNCGQMDDASDGNILPPDSKTAADNSSGSTETDTCRDQSDNHDEDDCIDLITPVKALGLADMSLSDSPPSFGDASKDVDDDDEEERGGKRDSLDVSSAYSSSSSSSSEGNDDVIIDLTSP